MYLCASNPVLELSYFNIATKINRIYCVLIFQQIYILSVSGFLKFLELHSNQKVIVVSW